MPLDKWNKNFVNVGGYKADDWIVTPKVPEFGNTPVLSCRGYFVANFMHLDDAEAILELIKYAHDNLKDIK